MSRGKTDRRTVQIGKPSLNSRLPAKTSRRSAKVLIFQWRSSLLGVQSPAEYRMPTAIDTDDRARFVKRLTIFPVTAAKVAT
jgi:hypothetical protein